MRSPVRPTSAVDPAEDRRTPAERSGYRTTPDYAETVAYLERLAAADPARVRIENFGTTGEGRELKLVVVSHDGLFDPDRIHAGGRVVLLVQNAIHAGEMDGKDACLALLRDLLDGTLPIDLLARTVWTFIPVYNVDGHERRSAFQRLNQNGPELAGWRANGTNLNLNRDYLKADAPETRAFLRMFRRWRPDFFVDNHATDGAEFQYDVTFALDATADVFPATADWVRETVTPELERRVNASGHLAFPAAVFLRDDTDPAKGLAYHANPPRFSTGQMILENRPGLLVELHMRKSYAQRVSGNYELLRALLELLQRDASKLIELNRAADRAACELGSAPARGRPFPLAFAASGATTPTTFRGIEFHRYASETSGAPAIRYGTGPWEATIPRETGDRVATSVLLPAGYIVPPAWTAVLDVLAAHGVVMRRTLGAWTGTVERYHLADMVWPSRPFEGRFPILARSSVEPEFGRFGSCSLRVETATFPAGSSVVLLDQPLSKVAIHWLEPEAPDSALRWGFFDPIFESKEGGEAYVLEPLAREMLAKDPSLASEFRRRLDADADLRARPEARLGFFYDRSPWGLANRVGEYPVGRLLSADGLPVA
jgi:murein tripeptide amidase MpaA